MEKFRWMELTSRQFKGYILNGGDMAVLPVGSMEVMGPHLPIGSKSFAVKALSELICKIHGGLSLPVMPLSPINGKKALGGVGLDYQVTLDYINDAVCEIFDNGIRRLIIVGFHEELAYVAAEALQLHDIPAVHINPLQMVTAMEGGRHKQFNNLIAGSLKLLGEDELLVKMLQANDKCLLEGYTAPDDLQPIAGLINVVESSYCSGVFPHFYGPKEYKILPSANIDADTAACTITAWVKDKTNAFEALSKYCQVFPRTKYERGLRMGGVDYEK